MAYVPHTPEERRRMLEAVGVASVDELFAEIGPSLRPASFDLPEGLSEMRVKEALSRLAAQNRADMVSFLGAGFYDHDIPSAVDALTHRGEFYTAYTPYQAEASQGTLQAIYEYQTAVCRLMELDAANASVYDGGTAIFEAIMMAVRHTGRTRIVVDESLSPIYRILIRSHVYNLELDTVVVPYASGRPDLDGLAQALNSDTAAVLVSNPSFFGTVSDFSGLFARARELGAVSIMSVYPVLQAVLKTPGAMGADIATAEGQSLGLPLSFGGPYLGIMTCKKELVRQMPGRIAGRTTDTEGRQGFVLTLQAREQHIRRHKATSNICSNQALCALRAVITACLRGPEGLRRQATASIENAHYLADKLTNIPGVSLLSQAPFGNEFAVSLPVEADGVIATLVGKGIIPGFNLGRYYPGLSKCLLVAATERHDRAQMDEMATLVRSIL